MERLNCFFFLSFTEFNLWVWLETRSEAKRHQASFGSVFIQRESPLFLFLAWINLFEQSSPVLHGLPNPIPPSGAGAQNTLTLLSFSHRMKRKKQRRRFNINATWRHEGVPARSLFCCLRKLSRTSFILSSSSSCLQTAPPEPQLWFP